MPREPLPDQSAFDRDPCDGCDGSCGDVCPVWEAKRLNDERRGPEIVVNGHSMGFGMEGMARALGAMIGQPATRPAEDRAESDEIEQSRG